MALIYLSVCVKRAAKVAISTSVVQFCSSSTFWDLLESVWKEKKTETFAFNPEDVSSVRIAKDSTFCNSCQDVQLHHQLAVCQMFDCKYVVFNLKSEESNAISSGSGRSAIEVLMSSAREKMLPSKIDINSSKQPRATDRLFNDVLDYLGSVGVGWSKDCAETTGKRFVLSLRDSLWYLDSHHGKFADRGINFPDRLSHFKNYNDWKSKKIKQPQVSKEGLSHHIDALSDALLCPWMNRAAFKCVLDDVHKLVTCMQKYRDHLIATSDRMMTIRHSLQPVRTPTDHSLVVFHEASMTTPTEYCQLYDALGNMYEPVFLEDFAPEDRYKRRLWIDQIALTIPFVVYSYQHGNYKGTEHFLWPVPVDPSSRSDTQTARVIAQLNDKIDVYATRAMKKAFIDKYSRRVKVPKMVLRHIFRELSGDSSASDSAEQQVIDERVSEFLLSSDDPSLLLDLRAMNGRPGTSRFDEFWDEVNKLVVENASVQERRHGNCLFLPIAMSVEDLKTMVADRLPEGTAIPSSEWIRLQFWPSNPYANVAVRHTGRFNLKFKVQSRLLRSSHEDCHYVAALYKYQKSMAVMLREHSLFVYVDDKANVPVGEPECPISTGVRGRQKAIVPRDGPALSALDHDFHVAGVTPSVALVSSIPSSVEDTFFSGDICVTTKDKVLQASSPLRHAAELNHVLRDKLDEIPPILFLYSDGGPDHRLTYGSVQVSLVCLFLRLKLDMIVAVRCAPHQSWTNLAERCMSILNLALQNVALQRQSMSPDFEKKVADVSTLSDLRNLLSNKEDLQAAYLKSMQPVIDLLNDRFSRMKLKESRISSYTGASESDIQSIFEEVLQIDRSLVADKLVKKELKKCENWKAFLASHTKSTHYSFQVKKCTSQECSYCQSNPAKTPDFATIHFLPDPEPTPDKLHYMKFEEMYGKETTEGHRPSLQPDSVEKEVDKEHRALLTSARVRDVVYCCECSKPRCIYSASKFTFDERIQVQHLKDEGTYTCGVALFPEGHPLRHTVVIREALKCSSFVEAAYYGAQRVSFELCCVYCGSCDDLVEDEEIREARKKFHTVRPICMSCKTLGKTLVTRGPNNLFSKRPKLQS